MTRRVRPAMVVAAGTALLVAACSVPVPEPSTTPGLQNQGALLEDQSARIIRQTFEHITAADAAADAGVLGDRVGDLPRQVRAAEYLIAANGGTAVDLIPGETQAVYASNSDGWPRIMVAVTEKPDATHTPLVLMWVQESPEAPYELEAWAHMVPNGVLPATPGQSIGATQLPLDSPGFVMSPEEAIDSYVTLLNAGATSDLESSFAPDLYRQRMFEVRTAFVTSVGAVSGTYTDSVTVSVGDSFALADAEGGALVFVRLEVASTFSIPAGAKFSLSAWDNALLTGTPTSSVVYRYEDFIVLRIGAEGIDVLPSVVAAGHHLVGVTAS